jgi:regulator of nucleoside diphosphate kinase
MAKRRTLYITQFDKERLEELMGVARFFGGSSRADLQDLEEEMKRAHIVSPQEIPSDVVTMNSQVLLCDIDTLETMTYTLVFPKDADIDSGSISVLAPVGTAILGYRQGDIVEWPVPAGIRRLRIEKVLYQPEAAGDYTL